MGARVYDPYTGMFLQTDPIQGGGANAYGYADGDPVNKTDLTGDSDTLYDDVCVRDGNCNKSNGDPKSAPSWGSILRDTGEVAVGGSCLVAWEASLAVAAASTAINVAVDVRSKASTSDKERAVAVDVAVGVTASFLGWSDDLLAASNAPRSLVAAHAVVHNAMTVTVDHLKARSR
jgi:uncharacterized protein RhaS with RHS repeats